MIVKMIHAGLFTAALLVGGAAQAQTPEPKAPTAGPTEPSMSGTAKSSDSEAANKLPGHMPTEDAGKSPSVEDLRGHSETPKDALKTK